MELRSTTGRRRRTTIQRLRRGTCSSPRTSTRPRPAARSHRARPPRSSTTVGYARAGWVAPATGTCTTTSASPSTPRPAWRPSSTATISPGTSGGTTTPPSRPKPQVPRSARAPEPAADYRAPEGWGTASGAPVVEPLATLLAQLPPGDLVAQDLGGLESAILQRLEQIVRDGEADIQADQVGELERTHGVVVAELHRLVDVLGGRDALLEHPHGLKPERHAQPTGSEAGRILDDDRLFPERLGERHRPLDGLGGGLRVGHHFDELHGVHRIEKMQAHDTPGVPRGRGDRGQDRKSTRSTRLNSSHLVISYAVFCLKKKKNNTQ